MTRIAGAGLFLLVAALPAHPAAVTGAPPFEPRVVPFDAEGALGLASLDYNENGVDDVAVALNGTDEICVLQGGSPILPEAAPRFPVGDRPTALVSGDLDDDGRDDLVVLNWGSTDLSILLGQVGGGFAPELRQIFLPGADRDDLDIGATRSLALADFDADGALDLAIATRADIILLRGVGDGSFALSGRVAAGDRPFALISGDFDADGRVDLAASHIASDDVVVLLGRGDCTFEPLPAVPAGITPRGLAAGDLDGDGLLDIVTANQIADDPLDSTAGDVTVLVGAGGGALEPAVRYRAGKITTTVVLGDFDADGHLDAAAGNDRSGDVSILMGIGDGTLAAERRVRAGPSPSHLLAMDHNNDGILDLVSSVTPAGVVFLAGRGDGTFVSHSTLPTAIMPGSIAAADVDGNGRVDLVLAGNEGNFDPTDLAIFPGRGDGSFGDAIALDTHEIWADPTDVAIADLNADGAGDIIETDGVRSIGIVLNSGGWSFASPSWIETGYQPAGFVDADFNGDGHRDLAVAHRSSAGLLVLLGRGNGGFDPGVRLQGGDLFDVEAADIDQDGHVDLAAVGTIPDPAAGWRDVAQVWRGTGDGRFELPLVLDLAAEPVGLALGDIDGDGRSDLLTAGAFDVTLFRNTGGLTLAPPIAYSGGWQVSGILATDVTRDGLADAVVLSRQREFVTVLPGIADGTLGPAVRTVGGSEPRAMAASDLDGDGAADLVTANLGLRDPFVGRLSNVSVLLNRAPPPNRPPVAVAQVPATAECSSRAGAPVRLDASASRDPDGVDANGLLSEFSWYEDYGTPAETLLGTEAVTDVTLGLGAHSITLVVTDNAGLSDTDEVEVLVEDTQPPGLALRHGSPSILWPPDHRLVSRSVRVDAADACGLAAVELVSVVSDEADDAPGGGDGCTKGDVDDTSIGQPDFEFQLRAERSAVGNGRTYTATYRARDRVGHTTDSAIVFMVPRDVR